MGQQQQQAQQNQQQMSPPQMPQAPQQQQQQQPQQQMAQSDISKDEKEKEKKEAEKSKISGNQLANQVKVGEDVGKAVNDAAASNNCTSGSSCLFNGGPGAGSFGAGSGITNPTGDYGVGSSGAGGTSGSGRDSSGSSSMAGFGGGGGGGASGDANPINTAAKIDPPADPNGGEGSYGGGGSRPTFLGMRSKGNELAELGLDGAGGGAGAGGGLDDFGKDRDLAGGDANQAAGIHTEDQGYSLFHMMKAKYAELGRRGSI